LGATNYIMSNHYPAPATEPIPDLSPEQKRGIVLLGGSTNPELYQGIAGAMGVELGGVELEWFGDDTLQLQLENSVRYKDVFVIQSHGRSGPIPGRVDEKPLTTIESFYQQLAIGRMVNRNGGNLTAVVPSCFIGDRSDRETRDREFVGMSLNPKLLEEIGTRMLITVDTHDERPYIGYDGMLLKHLSAQALLRNTVVEENVIGPKRKFAIVAPDQGSFKKSDKQATELGLRVKVIPKDRDPNTGLITRPDRIAGVTGRKLIMFDDQLAKAETLVTASQVAERSGAEGVILAATHAWFNEPAVESILDTPIIESIYVTDSLYIASDVRDALGDKLHVVSVAGLVADTMKKLIHEKWDNSPGYHRQDPEQ
jgi:ribose-phosphate pyrophosphokinase